MKKLSKIQPVTVEPWVQIRCEDGGTLEVASFDEAFRFASVASNRAEKISWSSRSGTRIRLVRDPNEPGPVRWTYESMEDTLSDGVWENNASTFVD